MVGGGLGETVGAVVQISCLRSDISAAKVDRSAEISAAWFEICAALLSHPDFSASISATYVRTEAGSPCEPVRMQCRPVKARGVQAKKGERRRARSHTIRAHIVQLSSAQIGAGPKPGRPGM